MTPLENHTSTSDQIRGRSNNKHHQPPAHPSYTFPNLNKITGLSAAPSEPSGPYLTKVTGLLSEYSGPNLKSAVSDNPVSFWLKQIPQLSPQLQEKYAKIFEEEEFFLLEQIKKLTPQYLHWMGVKVGSIIIIMEAIQDLMLSEEEDREHMIKRKSSNSESGSSPLTERVVTLNESGAADANNNSSVKVPQAGGHLGVIARVKPGLVRKMTDVGECNFYSQLRDTKKIPDLIKTFFPKMETIENYSIGFGLVKHYSIIMEDLTYGYTKPCVMDIKMGNRTYAEDSNLVKKKIRQIKDSDTTSSRYGLRITGYRTYSLKSGQYIDCSKEAAEKITSLESFEKTMYQFFDNGIELRTDVFKYYLERLNILYSWMETQNVYRFYSSSLLFIYDGASSTETKADVRMIDFAHVSEIKDHGNDQGYAMGLKKLMDCIKKLQCPATEELFM